MSLRVSGPKADLEGVAGPGERALYRLWRNADTLSNGLLSEDGRRWRVVYPGRASGLAGPDFRDCVVQTESGELMTGDVELHVNASDWDRHRHHVDPNYNGVVLHVVLRGRGEVNSSQEARTRVPVASLQPVIGLLSRPRPPGLPVWAGGDLGGMLDRAGDQRFLARSRGFALELRSGPAEQVLYRSLLEALGYSANRRPFQELARAVPLSALMAFRPDPPATRLLAMEAMLVKAAGLLSYVQPPEWARALREMGRHLPRTALMDPAGWHLFRVRPANHPVRRVAGAAHLVDRFVDTGLLAGLVDRVSSDGRQVLVRDLTMRPFIGVGRARDMAVNVVLPFVHAWSGVARRPDSRARSLELYRAFPALEDNEVTREMKRLLFPGRDDVEARGARRQQGLIHLYGRLTGRLPGGSPDGVRSSAPALSTPMGSPPTA